MHRLLALAAIVAAFAVVAPLGTASTTSTSSVPFHARIGKIYGMIPPVDLTTRTQNGQVQNNAPASGSLYYNGGPVMPTNKVYTIFWAPSGFAFPSGYVTNLNQYFKDLQATNGKDSNTYVNGTQYYDQSGSTKTYVQEHTTFSGTTVDTNALPALDPVNCPDSPVAATNGGASVPSTSSGCVTDQQVQQEISNVVKAKGWPVSNTTEFFMFTAPNIGTCFPATLGVDSGAGVQTQATVPLCSFSYFCAYHSAYYDSTVNTGSQIIYSNMPYAAQTNGNPLTCDLNEYPNGNPSDPEMSVTSHEHNESITDPFGTGWWDSNPNDSAYGEENGDMCAWDFGTTHGPPNAEYNQTINGHHYLMQLEWDNTTASSGGCPGSDANGNPVPTHPNYDTPEISLTPNVGYPTAPFKISGLFFNAGSTVASSFSDAGTSWALGTLTANPSGQFSLMTAVPSGAKAGTATVTSSGSAGKATAKFTVPSP